MNFDVNFQIIMIYFQRRLIFQIKKNILKKKLLKYLNLLGKL